MWLLILYIVYLHHKYELVKTMGILLCVVLFYLLCNRPAIFNESIKGEVKAVYYNGIQVDYYLIVTDTTNYCLGDVVEVRHVKAANFKKKNDGTFDENTYFKGKGIRYVTYPISIKKTGHQFHLRNKAITYLEKYSDERMKGIYLYLLLGMKNDEIKDLNTMATSMAIIHIFAISGMHFSLLMKMLVSIISHFMNEKNAANVTFIIMFVYAVCLEGNIAAWRAFFTLMFKKIGVKNNIDNFGLVGIVFLLCNRYIYLQTSFVYSMMLYFLVILTKHIKYSSLFVYIGSMVISIYFRYELVPLGFIFGFLFNNIIASLFPLFALDILAKGLISPICFYAYQGLIKMMNIACEFSVAIVVGKPPIILLFCFFIIYIYALNQWDIYKKKIYFIYSLVILVLIISHSYLNPFGKVVMLDVGQGDCFIISFPFNKENIMIDTGGLSYQDVASKRIIPTLKYLGISQVDTLYISHQDFDHCGALESLKSQYSIKNVVTDFTRVKHQDATFKQLNQRLYDNENDNSLVIYTTLGGLSYLFTGDISSDVENDLIKQYPNLDVDVLKVSHHGSNTSSSNVFIQSIRPTISLISVGKNNRYGHPSKEVLVRLNAYGNIVKRTDETGTIFIYFTEHKSYIEKPD